MMTTAESRQARIRARGFGYCYWRHGLLGFAAPLALVGTPVTQLLDGELSLAGYGWGLLFALPGTLLAAALFSSYVWRSAARESEATGSSVDGEGSKR
jgi:hypothetical protein